MIYGIKKSCLVKIKNNRKVIAAILIASILIIFGGVKIRGYKISDYVTNEAVFIWTEYSRDCDIMRLYQYGPNGQETLLEDRYEFRDFICSEDNERLLSFAGIDSQRFTIVEYDIENRELHTILEFEEIKAFLDENGYEKKKTQREGRFVRYYDDERKISFTYDRYLMGYSEEEGLEVIYATKYFSIDGYSWLKDGISLLICEDDGLIKYNTVTGKREMVAEGVRTFDLSKDEKFIIMTDKDQTVWKYDLETGKMKKIHETFMIRPILRISKDDRYLLYENLKTDMGASKNSIWIIELETGEKIRMKKAKYSEHILVTGVAWRN